MDYCNSQDDVEKRHKQDRKELQAKATNLKRSIAKGDKKRKREIAEEIAKLEADLERRHEEELARNAAAPSVGQLELMLEAVICEDRLDSATNIKSNNRVSKAQKRRDKKEQKDRDREELIRKQEEINVLGTRHLETEKLENLLRLEHLQIHEIPSDGDCLYSSVSHQLSLQGFTMSVSELRQQTAEFIRRNKDEFAPFLCDQDCGLPFTDGKFEAYCEEIETTPAWGGQLELRAISQVVKRPIEVLQAEGQPQILGEEFQSQRIVMTYHRHAYKLGEHYNSVIKANESSENDGFS